LKGFLKKTDAVLDTTGSFGKAIKLHSQGLKELGDLGLPILKVLEATEEVFVFQTLSVGNQPVKSSFRVHRQHLRFSHERHVSKHFFRGSTNGKE
jgi:hypothetical protein